MKVTQSCLIFATPWTVACQAPLSIEFSRQEYWSGYAFPSPGDFPNQGIKPTSPALQAESLLSEPPGKPCIPLSEYESESCLVMSDSLGPHGLYSPWNSPGQNTGVGNHSLSRAAGVQPRWIQGDSKERWIGEEKNLFINIRLD